jgi:hypothetical protein
MENQDLNNSNNQDPKVIIKYSSYTEAQKRAIKKYREKNKEKILEKQREISKKWYEKNQDTHREKALERYHNNKKRMSETTDEIEKKNV